MRTIVRIITFLVFILVLPRTLCAQDLYMPSYSHFTGSFPGEYCYPATWILQLENGRSYGVSAFGTVATSSPYRWMFSIDADSEVIRLDAGGSPEALFTNDYIARNGVATVLRNRIFWTEGQGLQWLDGDTHERGSYKSLPPSVDGIISGWGDHLFYAGRDTIYMFYPESHTLRSVCSITGCFSITILFDSNKDILLAVNYGTVQYWRSSDSGLTWKLGVSPGGYKYSAAAYDTEERIWYGLADTTLYEIVGLDSVLKRAHHQRFRGCRDLAARGGALCASAWETFKTGRHVFVSPKTNEVTYDQTSLQWSAVALKRDGSGMVFLRNHDTLVSRSFDGSVRKRHWVVAKNNSVSQVRTPSRALLSAARDTSFRALLRSTDEGTNWYEVPTPPPGALLHLANGPSHVVAVTLDGNVYVGDAEGMVFSKITVGVPERSSRTLRLHDDTYLIVGRRSCALLYANAMRAQGLPFIATDSVVDGAVSLKGRIALVQANGRISIDDGSVKFATVLHPPGLKHRVTSIAFDGNERIWVSTVNGATYTLDETSIRWQTDRRFLPRSAESQVFRTGTSYLWYSAGGRMYLRQPEDSLWTPCVYVNGRIVGGTTDELFCHSANYGDIVGSPLTYAWKPQGRCEFMDMKPWLQRPFHLCGNDGLRVLTNLGLIQFSPDLEQVVDNVPIEADYKTVVSGSGVNIASFTSNDTSLCWSDFSTHTETQKSMCSGVAPGTWVGAFHRSTTGEPWFVLGRKEPDVTSIALTRGFPPTDTLLQRKDSAAFYTSILETSDGRIGIFELLDRPTTTARCSWPDGMITTYSLLADPYPWSGPVVSQIQDKKITLLDMNGIGGVRAQTFDLETGKQLTGLRTFPVEVDVANVLPLDHTTYVLVQCPKKGDSFAETLYLVDNMAMTAIDSTDITVQDATSRLVSAVVHSPWVVFAIDGRLFRWKPTGMITDVPTPSLTNDAWSVRSVDGALMISDPTVPEQSMYHVYTHTGLLVAATPSAGLLDATLSTGLYIIQRVTPTSRSVRYCLNMK